MIPSASDSILFEEHPIHPNATDVPPPTRHRQTLRVYLSATDDFDFGRDHPGRLVWEEAGLSYDWAEDNTRQRRLNVSRAAVLEAAQQPNASAPVRT